MIWNERKGPGRGRGPWTAKGVQSSQDERIAELEAIVEELSAIVFGVNPLEVRAEAFENPGSHGGTQ